MKKKVKYLIYGVVSLTVIFLIYFGIHEYGNYKYMERYAKGYDKAIGGSKTKMIGEDICLSVIKAPLHSGRTNLAIRKERNTLIIWTSIWEEYYEYGLIVNDDVAEVSYQIELDEEWNAIDPSCQEILDKNAEEIEEIRQLMYDEWGIETE